MLLSKTAVLTAHTKQIQPPPLVPLALNKSKATLPHRRSIQLDSNDTACPVASLVKPGTFLLPHCSDQKLLQSLNQHNYIYIYMLPTVRLNSVETILASSAICCLYARGFYCLAQALDLAVRSSHNTKKQKKKKKKKKNHFCTCLLYTSPSPRDFG